MISLRKIVIFLFLLMIFLCTLHTKSRVSKRLGFKQFHLIFMTFGASLLVIGAFLDVISGYTILKIDNFISICFIFGSILFVAFNILFMNSVKDNFNVLYKYAYTDTLTDVYSRRGVDMVLQEKIANKQEFYVMTFDLDETKMINDNFGHLIGDKYIISAAMAIKEVIGDKGFVGRTGGDEFIAFIFDTNEEKIEEIKARIKKRFPEIFSKHNTSISIGFSSYTKDSKNIRELFKLADKRMYEDKEKGKII